MRKSRFTEEQIRHAVQQVEDGIPMLDVCRQYGIDKGGEIGFVGNVVFGGDAAGAEDPNVDLSMTAGDEWDSRGQGNMRAHFSVSVEFTKA